MHTWVSHNAHTQCTHECTRPYRPFQIDLEQLDECVSELSSAGQALMYMTHGVTQARALDLAYKNVTAVGGGIAA